MPTVTRLRTKPERLKAAKAAEIRQLLLPLATDPDVPQDALESLLYTLNRQAEPERSRETFVMLKPEQNAAVVEWLAKESARPIAALRVWALLFNHLEPGSCRIMLTREQIAEAVKISPKHVSEIMGELASFNAIFTERKRVAGMRGPGMVVYRMNQHVAEFMHRATPDELAQIPFPGMGFNPTIIEGGKGQ